MVMRVGGLASGMDIEAMVNKLMEAERIPLEKMRQDQTKLEWKRDAFRDINRELLKLDELMLDMKLSRTYQSKSVTSSQDNAITATARANSTPGSYLINVTQLATAAMNVGTKPVELDQVYDGSDEIKFSTYDVESKGMKEHTIKVEEGDTIGDILAKISNEDNNVRAFIDPQTDRVIIEATRTGKYNEGTGKADEEVYEIVFGEDKFFTDVLGMEQKNEIEAQNAKFTYNNGLELTSKTNSYEINGVNFQFHDVTNGNAAITVSNDVDHTVDMIKEFVEQYNQVVEAIHTSQREEIHRDYLPLTEEQKEEMSDKQIELWEERAKSGILRGESILSNGLFSMRQSWYSNVDSEGAFTSITNIGITTSPDYADGGKLIIDEEKLRQAVEEDAESVRKLFANGSDDESRGLINRLEDQVKHTMRSIERQAGKDFHTLDNYQLGKRMKQLNEEITSFEARMIQVENRYWNQFTAMERAIQRLSEQSSYLFSQFGGGM
ncbi:MAG TPA: flagellar hook-associated protein 2 [Bacillota bacterium]|nr:flagellar hook-associated protein 2 [Bacillota bacterium]